MRMFKFYLIGACILGAGIMSLYLLAVICALLAVAAVAIYKGWK